MSITAVDTETTGLDLYHGARPYSVAMCTAEGDVSFWEWQVDPLTRWVSTPGDDLIAIAERIRDARRLVGHNIKFDVGMLGAAGAVFGGATKWPWAKTEDSLVAAHLLCSNAPHDLTACATTWLARDILPFEKQLEDATAKCRSRVQQARLARKRNKPKSPAEDQLADWRIAEKGLSEMPSASGKFWKADGWLPKAMADHDRLPRPGLDCAHSWDWDAGRCRKCGGHHWWVVLADYAIEDVETTVRLWDVQATEIDRRRHWPLYRERMKALPTLLAMEARGVTVHRTELRRLKTQLLEDVAAIERDLLGIALGAGCPGLVLPKGGRNGSLDEFLFGKVVIACPVCKRENEVDGSRLDYARKMEAAKAPCAMCKEDKRPVPGRPKVVSVSGLCLPPVYNPKAKTDKPAFDAKIAIPWYKENLPPGPALTFIKQYEKRQGRLKAVGYLDDYDSACGYGVPIDETDWLTLHPTYHAGGTSLLRRSCSDPNLQQVGKKKETNLRRCLGPAPGREWWSMDYKNLELRIPAYESGEADLIALFENPDAPPFYGSEHLLNFSVVYPDVWEEEMGKVCHDCCKGQVVDLTRIGPHVKKKFEDTYYQWCKNGDFAVGYQAGDETADRTFRRPGSRRRLLARFAKKEAHYQRQLAFAKKHGWVETIPDRSLGMVQGYPVMVTRTEKDDVLPTTPLNFRTQGTAGWVTLKAMNRCAPKLAEWTAADQRGWFMILEVHDELVFDFPAGTGPDPWRTNLKRALELKKLMEQSGDDVNIPLPVDVEYHAVSWGDGLTVTPAMVDSLSRPKEPRNAPTRPPQRKPLRLVRRADPGPGAAVSPVGPGRSPSAPRLRIVGRPASR